MIRRFVTFLVLVALVGPVTPARADDRDPSAFAFAYEGLWIGGLAGLAGGYLVARENGLHSRDWKPLVYGAGIGALAGSAFGLTVGIVNVAQARPDRSRYIMRDMAYGEGFGALVGGLAGGLTAISSGKAEHVLLGSSIGVLSGVVLGTVCGFIEGSHVDGRPPQYSLSLTPVPQATGSLAFLPSLSGRY